MHEDKNEEGDQFYSAEGVIIDMLDALSSHLNIRYDGLPKSITDDEEDFGIGANLLEKVPNPFTYPIYSTADA